MAARAKPEADYVKTRQRPAKKQPCTKKSNLTIGNYCLLELLKIILERHQRD